MRHYLFLTIISVTFFITSCEETSTAVDYKKQPVVSATLKAGENIDTLWLTWTGEVDKYYNPVALAITNASVIIKGIDVNFQDSLIHDPSNPGRYFSNDNARIITPTKTYHLEINIPSWPTQVTAVTTVPDTFRVISVSLRDSDTLLYDTQVIDTFYWSPSNHHETYMPTITSLDQDAAMIVKSFYSDTTSKDFQRPDKITYRIAVPKEQTRTILSRAFFNYYGNNQLDVYAVDFNYSDFINQVIPAQGGEVREIRYNINGGIGVFGAKTRASGSIKIYMKPK